MLLGRSRILTGHEGISKTVSVCLFWHLTRFIDEYRFQKGAAVSKEMMRVPKMIYWKIDKNLPDSKQMVIDQCPEIKEKYQITDKNSYNWEVSIKNIYSKYFPRDSHF